METDFPLLKSVTKTPTKETSHTSSVFLYKRAFLKNVITPTKNREYQIVGTTTITYNDRIIQRTLPRLKIHDNYNRGNKVIAMSPAKDKVCYHYDLKPQLYKGVIIQQSNSAKKNDRKKRKNYPQDIDEGSSAETGFGFFRYFTSLFSNISILWKYIKKNSKLRFVFPNSLDLYVWLCFALLNFLSNNSVLQ